MMKNLLIIACLALHTSILMCSEEYEKPETSFAVIAKENEHYEKFQVLAKSATVTIIATEKGELHATLTIDDDSSTFQLSTDTIDSLLREWNWRSNSNEQGFSLWRAVLCKQNDLTVRLHHISQDELEKFNHIHHFAAVGQVKKIKKLLAATNQPILLPKQLILPIIPAEESKYFSIPAARCMVCDSSE